MGGSYALPRRSLRSRSRSVHKRLSSCKAPGARCARQRSRASTTATACDRHHSSCDRRQTGPQKRCERRPGVKGAEHHAQGRERIHGPPSRLHVRARVRALPAPAYCAFGALDSPPVPGPTIFAAQKRQRPRSGIEAVHQGARVGRQLVNRPRPCPPCRCRRSGAGRACPRRCSRRPGRSISPFSWPPPLRPLRPPPRPPRRRR